VTDVPAVFNVDFLDGPDNRTNVCGSKAVGEPPLLMAIAVWAAVKQAVGGTKLDLPASNAEILRRLTTRESHTSASADRNGATLSRPAPGRETRAATGVP
jgi:xanthine dehydrogenase large subunit